MRFFSHVKLSTNPHYVFNCLIIGLFSVDENVYLLYLIRYRSAYCTYILIVFYTFFISAKLFITFLTWSKILFYGFYCTRKSSILCLPLLFCLKCNFIICYVILCKCRTYLCLFSPSVSWSHPLQQSLLISSVARFCFIKIQHWIYFSMHWVMVMES